MNATLEILKSDSVSDVLLLLKWFLTVHVLHWYARDVVLPRLFRLWARFLLSSPWAERMRRALLSTNEKFTSANALANSAVPNHPCMQNSDDL